GGPQRADLGGDRRAEAPAVLEGTELPAQTRGAIERVATGGVRVLAGARLAALGGGFGRGRAQPVEAIDLARCERIAGTVAEPAHHRLPLAKLLDGHQRVEDALVGAEREQGPLDHALDEAITIREAAREHGADETPAIACLRGV